LATPRFLYKLQGGIVTITERGPLRGIQIDLSPLAAYMLFGVAAG
jgi:hypothetical protein